MKLSANIGQLILLFSIATGYAFATDVSPHSFDERKLGTQFTMPAQSLASERRIDLYLPEGYLHSQQHYPVVVVLDSNYLFDLVVATLRNRWQRDMAPQSIIVGIQARDASERFSYAVPLQRMDSDAIVFENAQPEKMDRFIAMELLNYVDTHYRTQAHRTIIGMSPTATNVVFDYLKAHSTFDAHLALAADFLVTPSFDGGERPLIEELVSQASSKSGFAFFSLASDDAERQPGRVQPFEQIEVQSLSKKGIHAYLAPNTEHYQHAAAALENAFSLLYPMEIWRPNYMSQWATDSNPVEYLRRFYQSLDNQYQMQTYPMLEGYWTANSVVGLVGVLNNQKRHNDALAFLQWVNTRIQNNTTVLYHLAEQSFLSGDIDQAKHYLKQGKMISQQLESPITGAFQQLESQLNP